MKFIFDLDDCLVSGDTIASLAAKLFRQGLVDKLYTNQDIMHYDLRDLPDLLRARANQEFSEAEYVWHKFPIPGANFFLHYIETSDHETGIVTARPTAVEEETRRFVIARFPGIQFSLGISFVNKGVSDMGNMPNKLELLKKLAPDYFFDDNADYCSQAKAAGIKTYLISNKYTPWNHEFAEQQRTALDPVRILRNVAFFPETSV